MKGGGKMGDLRELETIGQVIKEFMRDSELTKCSLVIRAGEVFLGSEGRNIPAEFFLRGFLTADPAEDRNLLSLAVADLRDKEKARRIKEIRENCFAFLSVYRSRIQQETRWVIEGIMANPPHPDFLRNVKEKMAASKMAEEAAAQP